MASKIAVTAELAVWLSASIRYTDYCWIWTNPVDRNGRCRFRGARISPPRIVFQIEYGELPPGMSVLRHCGGDTRCVRPDHHHAGSGADRARHALREWRARTGGQHPTAKATPELVAAIREARAGGASCRQIAQKCGLSLRGVQHIVRGDVWRDVGALRPNPAL